MTARKVQSAMNDLPQSNRSAKSCGCWDETARSAGGRRNAAKAFGDRLGEARGAMEALAASLPPEELNRVGFRLYERFRPNVPAGTEGWGATGCS
jgi:hypothetical protein